MNKLALLGKDISYTLSPDVHCAIARTLGKEMTFDTVNISSETLAITVDRLLSEYDGFFVTKPYKLDVKQYVGFNRAASINVVRSRDRAVAETDGDGFLLALDRNFADWRIDVNNALVLGAGGAARSVATALSAQGKRVFILDRTAVRAAKLCTAIGAELYANQSAQLIVNCTSAGWNGEDVLHSLCVLPEFDYAFDLVYARGGTPFIKRCAQSGGRATDGTDMLIYQAIEGEKFIYGRDLDTEKVFDGVKKILDDTESKA